MSVIADYVLYFLFYSFLGWVGETIYCSYGQKKFVNRGFLAGPLCPIYGTGATVFSVCLMPFYDKFGYSKWYIIVLVIVLGMILADIVEFLTSLIMEKLFNARWWDYSNKKFNIQGRICLGHTMYWGIAAGLFIYLVHPRVVSMFTNVFTPTQRIQVVLIALAVFVVDLFFAVKGAFNIRKFITKLNSLYEQTNVMFEEMKSNVSQTYENIHDHAQKSGLSIAVRAADIARQISEMRTNFAKSDGSKQKDKNIIKHSTKRLYNAFEGLQNDTKTKIDAIETKVKEFIMSDSDDKNDK